MARTLKSAIYIFILSLLYAILRYHIFKGVLWVQFPVYVLNKVFALSAFTLFALSFSVCPIQKLGWLNVFKPEECKYLGWVGMMFLMIHVFMSYTIFTPVYFAKFFGADGSLSLVGNLSLVFGIFGVLFIILYQSIFRSNIRNDKYVYPLLQSKGFILLGLMILCAHVFVMGIKGWISPGEWPGYMPPISLVGFVFLFTSLFLNIIVIKR